MSLAGKQRRKKNMIRLKGKSCYYCRAPLTKRQVTIDHYVPRALGGCGHRYNLVVCCYLCNHYKGDRTGYEWEDIVFDSMYA